MSCTANKLDLCRLVQNEYTSPLLVFDTNIAGDEFSLKIYQSFSRKMVTEVAGIIAEDSVTFPEFSLPKNTYIYEIIRNHNGNDKLILFGKYVVTNEPQPCGCSGSDTINFTVDDGDTAVNFSYQEVIIGGVSGTPGPKGDKGDPFVYEDFTPEQLEGLRGPQGVTGATGAQGIQGLKGDTGATGAKGDKGDTGANGTSVTVILASSESNAITLSAANPNNIYFWE